MTEFYFSKMFSQNGENLPPKNLTNTLRCFICLFSVGGGAQGQGYDWIEGTLGKNQESK
jgi:hypothetical protein